MFLFEEALPNFTPEPAGPAHLSEDQLERYLMISTPLEQVAEIEERLFFCERCQARLHKLDEYATIVREALVSILANEAVAERKEGQFDGCKVVKWPT